MNKRAGNAFLTTNIFLLIAVNSIVSDLTLQNINDQTPVQSNEKDKISPTNHSLTSSTNKEVNLLHSIQELSTKSNRSILTDAKQSQDVSPDDTAPSSSPVLDSNNDDEILHHAQWNVSETTTTTTSTKSNSKSVTSNCWLKEDSIDTMSASNEGSDARSSIMSDATNNDDNDQSNISKHELGTQDNLDTMKPEIPDNDKSESSIAIESIFQVLKQKSIPKSIENQHVPIETIFQVLQQRKEDSKPSISSYFNNELQPTMTGDTIVEPAKEISQVPSDDNSKSSEESIAIKHIFSVLVPRSQENQK